MQCGEDELVKRRIERLCAFPGSSRDAGSSHDAPSADVGGVPTEGLAVDPAVLETARALALRAFPAGSTVEWSDDVDENDVPLELMTVVSPATPAATHEAYVAFVRAWVRAEPPERRRRIRVPCRAGVLGYRGRSCGRRCSSTLPTNWPTWVARVACVPPSAGRTTPSSRSRARLRRLARSWRRRRGTRTVPTGAQLDEC